MQAEDILYGATAPRGIETELAANVKNWFEFGLIIDLEQNEMSHKGTAISLDEDELAFLVLLFEHSNQVITGRDLYPVLAESYGQARNEAKIVKRAYPYLAAAVEKKIQAAGAQGLSTYDPGGYRLHMSEDY